MKDLIEFIKKIPKSRYEARTYVFNKQEYQAFIKGGLLKPLKIEDIEKALKREDGFIGLIYGEKYYVSKPLSVITSLNKI